jgi:hypothetical protein
MQVQTSRSIVLRLLSFLQEARYLDSMSLATRGRLVTHNEEARCFAIIDLYFSQAWAGTFNLQVDVTSVPESAGLWDQGLDAAIAQTLLVACSVVHVLFALDTFWSNSMHSQHMVRHQQAGGGHVIHRTWHTVVSSHERSWLTRLVMRTHTRAAYSRHCWFRVPSCMLRIAAHL